MPTYEYKCTKCDHQFDIWQEVGAEPPACPECESVVKKIFHPVSVHYKGSGFYVTDSRSKNASASSEKKTETKTESKADDKSNESKPAASETSKTETAPATSSSSTSNGGDKEIK